MLTPEQRASLQGTCIGDDLDAKDKLIAELSERVAAQSELLSRKAEASPLFDRVVAALRKMLARAVQDDDRLFEQAISDDDMGDDFLAEVQEARAILAEVDAAKGA